MGKIYAAIILFMLLTIYDILAKEFMIPFDRVIFYALVAFLSYCLFGLF